MKRLTSIITFLLCFSGLMLLATGCGKSSGGGGGDQYTEVKKAIAAKINSFKTSVEAYNVDGMLAFLDENNFEGLYIAEGNNPPYEKNYNTLRDELKADEDKQLNWRNPVPDGKGYALTMELDSIVYSNLSQSGAVASVGFTIKEKADGVPEKVTDTGTMVCEMVNTQGEWFCRRLTINFVVMDQGTIFSLAGVPEATDNKPITGFGFGSLILED